MEVARLLETLVHAGETQIGDVVELLESLEDRDAHLLAGRLRRGDTQGVLHGLRQLLHLVVADGAVLARGPHALDDLGPVEGLTQPAPLHHPQGNLFDALEGREAAAAAEALATATGRLPVLGLARIDDAVVIETAPGTPHTADVSQGMKMCSPGTMAVEPTSRASRTVSGAACAGSTWAAIEASVSPALTM